MKRWSLAAVLLLAAVCWGDVHTFPPGGLRGTAGSSGPKADELLQSSLLNGLQAYWTFDGASTTFAADDPSYYGYDSHADYDWTKQSTGPASTTTSKLGGRAVRTNTAANRAFTITTTAFRQAGGFSYCFWETCASAPCASNPINLVFLAGTSASSSGADYGASHLFSGTVLQQYFDSAGGVGTASNVSASLTAGTFKHFCLVYDASTKQGLHYVNGTPGAAGTTLPNGLRQTSTSIWAAHNNDTQTTNEAPIIDELGVWSRALTSTEIACLYGSGSPPAYPFTGVCL